MPPGPVPPGSASAALATSSAALVRERWPLFVLGGLVILAAIARLYDVTGTPKGFFTDEASYGLNSYLILTTGKDEYDEFMPLFFRAFGEYKLPLYIYGEIPFIAILGRTELAVRAASAFFGTLTVLTTYLLAKELFRRELPALVAAASLAILPWHIHYSRTGFGEVVLLPLVFTTAFYLFFRATRDRRFVIPSALMLGLTFYAYRPSWITVPPLVLIMLVAYRKEILADRKLWLTAAGFGLLLLLPIGYHLFLSGSGDRSSQASIFNIEGEKTPFELFVQFYRSYFTDSFLFAAGDNSAVTRHYLPGHGQLYYLQLPLILIGVVALAGRLNRRYLFVLALLVLYPLSASVSDSSPISTRSILGTVAFALLTGAGVWAVADTLRAWFPSRAKLLGSAVVVVFALGGLYSFGAYVERYHSEYARLSDGYWGWQDGPKDILAYFETVEGDYDEMFMDGTFNAPNVFLSFFGDGDCAKCLIGANDKYEPSKRQLFALRPESLDTRAFNYRLVDALYAKNGSVSFVFVEITGKR